MSFPRYPKYKDSGVEWLGEVPEHWKVMRVKHLTDSIEQGWSPQCEGFPVETQDEWGVLKVGCVNGGIFDPAENKALPPDLEPIPDLGICSGDLLISRANTRELVGSAAVVAKDYPKLLLCDKLYRIRLKPDLSSSSFVSLYLGSSGARGSIELGATGASTSMVNIGQSVILELMIAVPPSEEQHSIAITLERELSKIDELVTEQRRLMELLREKRQAVISHAVTKGLNPHAPMKPSGIEWLGDVPEHWQVRRVKSVSTFITSGPRGWSERVSEEGSLFVQSGDLNDALEVEFAGSKRVQVANDAEAARTLLCDGDVVVCITGAKTGNVAVCAAVPEAAYINQHLCLIRPTPDILPFFLGVVLKSELGRTYFELSQYGLKQGLSLEDVKEAPILLPPLNEQAAIITYLDAEIAKLDALTTEAQRAIDLLQERRAALISAAVTGRIDVRSFAERQSA